MFELERLVNPHTVRIDPHTMSASVSFESNWIPDPRSTWVSFDTVESQTMKLCYAHYMGLAGVNLVDSDSDGSGFPLVRNAV